MKVLTRAWGQACVWFGVAMAACTAEPPPQPVMPASSGDATVIRSVPVPDKVEKDVFRIPKELTATETGLKIWHEKEGVGIRPKPGQVVAIHFTGWRKDGVKLDSSKTKDPPLPIRFPLGEGNQVQGWTEGISLMKVGGIAWLEVPPELAYGSLNLGMIPPNSTLYYRIELYEVQ